MATVIVVTDLASPAAIGRGGLAVYELQWVHGLERLGHQVLVVEFLPGDPGVPGRAAAARYFGACMALRRQPELGALFVESPLDRLHGLDAGAVARHAGSAAAIITLAARYRRDPYPLVADVRPRILIEQDPGYTHLWATGGDPADVFGEHDLYFTVGGNIGSSRCALPTFGIRWRPICNPVVLDWWPPGGRPVRDRFTTVADWRSYGYLEYGGQVLGPKAEEFRKFIDLPGRAGESLEIALNIDAEDPDLGDLRSRGWKVQSPEAVATPDRYRDYVTNSAGEFSCVKGGYAGTHCGWFSDRSACYLAAGRPVVLQATGFEELFPTGRGLFAVHTAEEAAEAIRVIRRDYRLHAAAARELARAHLDSGAILGRLLGEAGVP